MSESRLKDRHGRPLEQPERRKFGRRPTFKPAYIVLSDGRIEDCFLVDISESGARIQIRDPAVVPERFVLVVEVDDFIVTCGRVHIHGASVGMRFIASPRKLSWLRRAPST